MSVLSLGLSACGSSGTDQMQMMTGALAVYPDHVYTAVDEGGLGDVVPVLAMNSAGIVWTASDDSMLAVSESGTIATITAKKAGDATASGTAGGKTVTVRVSIATYTAAQKAAGQVVYDANTCGMAACHTGGGSSDITPSGIGKHTADEVLAATTMNANPEGGMLDVSDHAFTLTADEQQSLLAYLRSLPPRGPPEVDE